MQRVIDNPSARFICSICLKSDERQPASLFGKDCDVLREPARIVVAAYFWTLPTMAWEQDLIELLKDQLTVFR